MGCLVSPSSANSARISPHYRSEFEAVARKTCPKHHGRAFGVDVQNEVLIWRQRIHAGGVFAQLWLQRGKEPREKVEDAGLIAFSQSAIEAERVSYRVVRHIVLGQL